MTLQTDQPNSGSSRLRWIVGISAAMALSGVIGLSLLWPTIKHMQEMRELITEEPDWFDADKPDKLAELIAAHPSKVSYSFLEVDETGAIVNTIEQEAEILRMAGPSVKIFYLAAYADLVASGDMDPEKPVDVAVWERHHLPGLNGGAHTLAMQNYGLKVTDYGYIKERSRLTWDKVIEAAFRFSDLSAIDFLAANIEPEQLEQTMKKYGCVYGPSKISILGSTLAIDSHTDPMNNEKWEKMKEMNPIEFRKIAKELEERFLTDEKWREAEIESRKGFYGRKMSPRLRREALARFGPRASVADINKILVTVAQPNAKDDPATKLMKQYLELPMRRPEIANRYDTLGTFGGFSLGNMGIALYAKPQNDERARLYTILFNEMPISAWNALRHGDGLLSWLHLTAEGKMPTGKRQSAQQAN